MMGIPQKLSWLLAALMLVVGVTPAHSAVLCIGADGDVALEAGKNGACASSDDCDSHGEEDEESHHGHRDDTCGDCHDLTIYGMSSSAVMTAAHQDVFDDYLVQVPAVVDFTAAVPDIPCLPDILPLPFDSPTLGAITTVVLRN